MADHFDLVVLGAGSTAFAAALRAQALGRTVLLTEERVVGGTCANRGCLPSKNLIEAARLVHDARHPRYPGLAGVGLGVDFAELVRQKDEIVVDYRARKYDSLAEGQFDIAHGHVELEDPHTVSVDGRRYTGEVVLVATGSRPHVPDIEGLDRVPWVTSDLLAQGEPAELTTLPRSILIVGAGYVALELGQMFRRFGADVTLVERGPEILSRGYEPEVGPTVRELLEAEGLRILTSSSVRAVRADGAGVVASVVVNGVPVEVRAERLVVATGRRPSSDRIGLERVGVAVGEDGGILVDEHLRTNVPTIYAAGDVVGRSQASQMATPVGSHDGGIVAHNAFSGQPLRRADHRVVPRAIFVDPPVAVVGMIEAEAVAAGHHCWCRAVPMSLVPRAGAIRDTRGFVKMVADAQTNEVLGVTMVGHGASEVIHEAAMALRFRARLEDFVDLLHVYPTMAEALKIAAISRFKDPTRLSCCAE
jgi:mercuric reductase